MEKNTTLQINLIGSANLGRCYNSATYEVLTHYEIKDEKLKKLWEVGMIGCGQEFRVTEKSHRITEDSAVLDLVKGPVFRAVCEVRCDSGD